MSKLIDVKTGKEYIPQKGQLDPNSKIMHDVISGGRLVYRTSRELLLLRGIVREESTAITPDEILTKEEVAQRKLKPQPQSVHSLNVHVAIGKILFARRGASQASITPQSKQSDTSTRTHTKDEETDPLGYECC
jgi:hypothetical protein